MAISREEISNIGKEVAERTMCLTKCVSAGQSVTRDHDSFHALYKTPVIYQENLKGLVRTDDLIIPHSELAMHTGAAGKTILTFFCTPRMAFVVYEDEGGCGYVDGLNSELLSRPLQDKVKEIWGPEPTQYWLRK